MHATDAQLLLLLDPQPLQGVVKETTAHLDICETCRARLAVLRQEWGEVEGLLELLGGPIPSPGAELLMAGRARGLARRLSTRAAAGVALLLFAAGAAAMPHSPVRAWIEDLLRTTTSASPIEAESAAEGERTGVGILPSGPVEILLPEGTDRGRLIVELTAGPELRLGSTDAGMRFRVTGLTIAVSTSADSMQLTLRVPWTLGHLAVRVGDIDILTRQGDSWSRGVELTSVGDRAHLALNRQSTKENNQ